MNFRIVRLLRLLTPAAAMHLSSAGRGRAGDMDREQFFPVGGHDLSAIPGSPAAARGGHTATRPGRSDYPIATKKGNWGLGWFIQ